MKITKDELHEMQWERRLEFCFHNGQSICSRDLEIDTIYMIKNLAASVREIAKTDIIPFHVKTEMGWSNVKCSIAGNRLLQSLMSVYFVYLQIMQKHTLTPAVKFTMDKFSFMLNWENMNKGIFNGHQTMSEYVELMNTAAAQVRQYIRSSQYKKDMNNYSRSSRKNYASLRRYIERLFKNHSRLLVMRIDLEYRSAENICNQKPVFVSHEEAKADREVFLKGLAKRFPAIKGYAWSMEYGIHRGYHYHAIFFADSRYNPRDIDLASAIGDFWSDEVTQGRGFAYNCNALKSRYRSCGIGMIDHFNEEGIKGLLYACHYMTKTDELMKLVLSGNNRSFGRGTLPAIRQETRGRKRRATENHFCT
ncbi:YagK/YfjJ domain-containing protein [Laribacter hongkongensis]|uniref:YagK/YfjJ domain-containing protein n=1 Tax=Laribacter hongkongensis TaxID=168471 RepID=UPI001EFCBBB8|nr:inovirus-type Gp2 protein [Laribacter hongkongensis]MCG9078176.1 inovirus Gp2 family protein [Laribacter hongkongensis]